MLDCFISQSMDRAWCRCCADVLRSCFPLALIWLGTVFISTNRGKGREEQESRRGNSGGKTREYLVEVEAARLPVLWEIGCELWSREKCRCTPPKEREARWSWGRRTARLVRDSLRGETPAQPAERGRTDLPPRREGPWGEKVVFCLQDSEHVWKGVDW